MITQQLGRYQLLRRLAVGGMAEIYLGRAQGISGFEKLIVVKRMLPHHALDPQRRRMFLDEARLMATLTHPNVTQVYDVGTSDDVPFFVMEYVHGANVREILLAAGARAGDGQQAALPLAHAVGIVAAASAGLHYAHEKRDADGQPLRIVHRDVSPSNVLVTYDGSVKVSDFGIAKWASQRSETQDGTLKGKLSYMSPEQCRGLALDRRSDVFALGTLLFELVTGEAPFKGASDYELLMRIVNQDAPPPRLPADATPPELQRIIGRALARDPEARYQTAQDLQLELETFTREQRLLVSPVALGESLRALFEERLRAWEQAEREGKSLAQHLAEVAPVVSAAPTLTDAFAPTRNPRRPGRLARVTGVIAGAALLVVVGTMTAIQLGRRHPTADQRAPVRVVPDAPPAVGATPTPIGADRQTTAAATAPPPASPQPPARAKRVIRARLQPAEAPAAVPTTWDPDSPVPP